MASSRSSGFTLVEVLAALAIAAITLAAAARAVALSVDGAAQARLRLLAGIVAENRIAELAARREWPAPGLYSGLERQAGVDFAWRAEIESTPHPAFRRIEVRVTAPDSGTSDLRRLVAVLPRER